MTPAAAAILDGMPHRVDLRRAEHDGMTYVSAGQAVLACYPSGDIALRNVAVAVARQLGFPGTVVAEVMGLTENYVATLHRRALREGTAGLVRPSGPRPKLPAADWERARRWRAAGATMTQVAARLGVAQATVSRHLGGGQQELPADGEPAGDPVPGSAGVPAGPEGRPGGQERREAARGPEPAQPGPEAGQGTGRAVALRGSFRSRYAGAMLLHAFGSQVDASSVFAAAGCGTADVALLSAVTMCFALGAVTTEQFKHLAPAEAGPLAGLPVLPGLRTVRPKLAAVADATDPLELQALFAKAMLAADPVLSGVYYVDDHFVPYAGARPVAKGWNNKRGRAERGHADTHVTAHDGRAVCFITGEPSGLVTTLPLALAELARAAPPGGKILLGFDRGGSYAQVFRHCKEQGADWVTWRRAPLAVPARLPVLAQATVNGRQREIAWTDEAVTVKDYGTARQLTLFEHGKPALQALTSDEQACPAEVLSFLRSRWREENFLKYAAANYGIDKICDYIAVIEASTKITENPARKAANSKVRQAEKELAAAREGYAVMLADPAIPAPAKNARQIPAAQARITRAGKALAAARAARDEIPAKLPANVIEPGAQVALLRASRRGLQMVLRLLAHNAEHWLAGRLNAYLQDDDEYRAIARETIIRGLAGTITCNPRTVTVDLDRPASPRVARALSLLLDELNATPPALPADSRPITYRLTAAHPI